ncbi:MAG TPA: ATP-binding protein [Steroidobacteraceae bacterium]|nr:ATP-binding protein [Steroidobacteraceae bacterium]
MAQILTNLLTNASRYSEPGSRIEVTGHVEQRMLALSVRDHGIGIAPESIAGIFQMFSQIDAIEVRTAGGLGIGLALVRGLVELHGGSVEAHSAGLGKGSEFIVRLPVDTSLPATLAPTCTTVDTEMRHRILLADDNQDAADSLATLLELAGHEVRVAYGGRDALAVAEDFRPDTVVLDIGMPDLTGHEVAAELRQRTWAEKVRLIALTGWGQQSDRLRASKAGFDLLLVKPVDPDRLEATIRGLSG